MAILNYTTSINANTTVGQIQSLLASKGARKIMVEYSPEATVSALSFEVLVNDVYLQFRLPANWKGVQKAILKSKKTVAKNHRTDTHAVNVCWRIIKDWIEAQMSIIEAEQADIATVFLPYAIMQNGDTISENFIKGNQGKQLLLSSPAN